jgi:predicted nucleic acid-binding Zn ribbon protein
VATYEFKCSCGMEMSKSFPVLQERIELPRCACGKMMRRKFSAPAIIFKGSGFYSTSR